MNLSLRSIEIPQALELEEFLDQAVAESSEALGEDRLPPGSARRFLERAAGRIEALVLFAEEPEAGGPVALCITVPYEDPLSLRAVPLVAALYVIPRLRNRGVARALVHETTRLLAARGIHTLAVRAGHNDDALISMGERWGFVRGWEWMTREE